MALEARRAELERRIRVASSRQVLVPLAERTLGLHEPADSEFTLLPVPPSPDRQALMAKPAARIAAIQFGFALGVWRCWRGRPSSRSSRASSWAREAESKRTERLVLAGAAGRALRPERRAAGHHPGVLPRRHRAERAGRPRRRVPPARPQPRRVRAARSTASSARGSAGSICTAPSTRPRSSRCGRCGACTSSGSFQRFYPSRELARPIIGGLDGRPAGRRRRPRAGARLDSHRDGRARRCC